MKSGCFPTPSASAKCLSPDIKELVKNTPDGLSVDVKGTVLEKLGTADDILKSLPFVRKKQDKYEVEGKGTTLIYLNGRKIQNVSELDQLGSENIKRVELIENPGAKYDASARVVIKIVTARKEGEGFGFENRSSFYASEKPDLTEQFNFNYQHKGIDIFGMAKLDDYKGYYKSNNKTEVMSDTLWIRNLDNNNKWHTASLDLQLGANYTTGENSFGLKYSMGIPLYNKNNNHYTLTSYCNGSFEDYLETSLKSNGNEKVSHEFIAYYNGKVGKLAIDFNADFLYNGNNPIIDYTEFSLNGLSREMTSIRKVSNILTAARLDLSYPFLGGTFSFGTEINSMKRNDDNLGGIDEIPITYFSLNELTTSAYMEYARNIKICDMKLGLRYEYQKKKYHSNGILLEEQSGNTNRFFPNLSLSRNIGKFTASASYSTNISRPSFSSLGSSTTYMHRYLWMTGNPYLRPSLYNSWEINLSYGVISLLVEYCKIKNYIVTWGDLIHQTNGVILAYPKQLDKTQYLYAHIAASPHFGIFTTSFGVSIYKMWAKIPLTEGYLNLKNPILYMNAACTATISPSFNVNLMVNYISSGEQANQTLLKDDCFDVQISATKSFLSERLSFKLAFYDIFRRQASDIKFYYDNINTSFLNVRNKTRKVELTIRYKFNSTPSKFKGNGAGNKEKQRL